MSGKEFEEAKRDRSVCMASSCGSAGVAGAGRGGGDVICGSGCFRGLPRPRFTGGCCCCCCCCCCCNCFCCCGCGCDCDRNCVMCWACATKASSGWLCVLMMFWT
jgi:hypothetical protein